MLLVVVHLAAVWFCVGLVWVVQVLVYPEFRAIERSAWREHHDHHTRLMTWTVCGPWAVQGVTCAALLVWRPAGVPFWLAVVAGVCGAATVAVTLGLSVPCHRRLAVAYDDGVLDRLVRTNWYRTAAWTAGGVVAVAMVLLAAP
ncbi:hypothetical protein LQ327_24920 [Actinomycetospora endophytica]|uniref:DUF1772 domain-containing protein n=1 Tax=Actinomycetospora endophytica TaxID=2291215 RepID=A0ABS8PEB1_9PSEU|nr:hypothetical protein [Actinomycetospora endophytica]MCD2196620.1 hypothetical protein [Actinomycetospora endophytica]